MTLFGELYCIIWRLSDARYHTVNFPHPEIRDVMTSSKNARKTFHESWEFFSTLEFSIMSWRVRSRVLTHVVVSVNSCIPNNFSVLANPLPVMQLPAYPCTSTGWWTGKAFSSIKIFSLLAQCTSTCKMIFFQCYIE